MVLDHSRWGFILLMSCFMWETASAQAPNQGYCGRYKCQRDTSVRENMLMKCISEQPLEVHNRINETVPSVYDCIADLHVVDLQFGVTICSDVPQTHIMDVRPGTRAALELFQLYRLIDTVSRDSGNTNSRCFLQDLKLNRGINIQPTQQYPSISVSESPNIVTAPSSHVHYYSRNVLIGAIIGAFIAGLLVAIIILLCIYYCCVRGRNEKARQITNPSVNRGYQHDSNANLSIVHENRQKDWSREQRNVINRMDGMIDAYSYGDPVDPYASIEESQPERQRVEPREAEDNISAMYSTVDVSKKTGKQNNTTGDIDTDAFSFPSSSGAYYALEEDSFSSADPGPNTTSSTIQMESNAESAEIVPPENALHYYHVLEKSAES